MKSRWALLVALLALAGLVSADAFAAGTQRPWYDRFVAHSAALASLADEIDLTPVVVGDMRSADDLLAEMQAAGAEGGGTSSPFTLDGNGDSTGDGATTGASEMPSAGYAVALEGSDMIVAPVLRRAPATSSDADGPTSAAYVAERDRFDAWYAHMYPLMTTGWAWVGYYWNDSTGDVEINLTLVLADRDAAVALGESQNQWSIWSFAAADVISTNDHGPRHWEREHGTRRIHIPASAEALSGQLDG